MLRLLDKNKSFVIPILPSNVEDDDEDRFYSDDEEETWDISVFRLGFKVIPRVWGFGLSPKWTTLESSAVLPLLAGIKNDVHKSIIRSSPMQRYGILGFLDHGSGLTVLTARPNVLRIGYCYCMEAGPYEYDIIWIICEPGPYIRLSG